MKRQREKEFDETIDTGKTLTEEDLKSDENDKSNEKFDVEKSELEKKLADANANAQNYLQMAQQVQAEFDNFRKRNMEIAKNSRADGTMYAVETLLPVIDSINSAKRQVTDSEFLKSIGLLYNQTLDCFSKLGVKKIIAIGKPFNPELHNAIMTEHKDGIKPDIVLDELQEGFELDGKVIRHSVVKVSK